MINPGNGSAKFLHEFLDKPGLFITLTDMLVQVKMYGLLTKCEVKMAGYWLSSFFACQ